jgi:hypothetical protein
VNRENLAGALAVLEGCWKSSSLLWMHAHDFPVLSGLILNEWFQKSEEAVTQFSREKRISELLVRIEKPRQRWTRQRGGYTIPLIKVPELVESLALEGLIAILLEPASPNSDAYSLTSVCDVETGRIDVEVVGPGFDASDILRSDITPHERFEVTVDNSAPPSSALQNLRRVYLVDPENYRTSVRRRMVKIGARLRKPSFPEEVMLPGAPVSTLEGLVNDATHYLRTSGHTVLFDHADQYEPIPRPFLNLFLNQLLRLYLTIAASHVVWRTFSLAGSFLSEDRLVIWDFFPPGDYDTKTLLDLQATPA